MEIDFDPNCPRKGCENGVNAFTGKPCQHCNPDTKGMRKKGGSILSLMKYMKAGETFIVEAEMKNVTAWASINKIKVKCEVVYVMVGMPDPVVQRGTRVMILKPK